MGWHAVEVTEANLVKHLGHFPGIERADQGTLGPLTRWPATAAFGGVMGTKVGPSALSLPMSLDIGGVGLSL